MKQETKNAATLIWEWKDAPQQLRAISPAYDDVSYLVILPTGTVKTPDWVDTLVHPGGGGDDWKCILGANCPEFTGRVLVAVTHA